MKSYLRQFKEQIELILMNIDSDNMSEKFEDNLFEGFSKRMKDSKTMSEITQTAGMIKMAVKDLEGSMASLTLTVNGIESEVYDSQGNSRITQTANAIVAEANRATGAEGNLSGRIAVLPASVSISASADGKTASFQLTATKEGGGSIVMSSDTITFTGLVSFTNLQTSGQTVINGGNISTGSISIGSLFNADIDNPAVQIAGYVIDEYQIKTPADQVQYGGIALQRPHNGTNWAFAIGYTNYNNYSGAPFRVSHGGEMYATNAHITGEITATNGEIGGFTITSTELTTTTPSDPYHGFTLDSNGEITIAGSYVTYIDSERVSTHYVSINGGGLFYRDTNGEAHDVVWKRASAAVTDNDYVLVGA
jgi:hypothetical protein